MLVKPFLATYVKVLAGLTVGTLAVITGLYFTGSTSGTHTASHKPGSITAVPHTPSPVSAPKRTASSFADSHPVALDYAKPTIASQSAAAATPKPHPSPTATKTPTRPTPAPSPSSDKVGVKVSVKLPVLPRVGVSVSRSSTRTGSARTYARSVLSATQYACLDSVVIRESGWNPFARNPYSGAYGLGQALPGSKMASAGADWRTNGVTQIKWTIHYMNGRYGSPCGAWSFWRSHHWY